MKFDTLKNIKQLGRLVPLVAFAIFIASGIIVSPNKLLAQAPACSDGIDNDGDGKVDALLAPNPANAAPRVWTKDPFGITGFVNSKAAEYGFHPIGDGSALNLDITTAQFVCALAGYSGVASMDCVSVYDGGRCGWYSPSDNRLDHWNPAINNFVTVNARDGGNRWLSSLTCINKIPTCSDGKDNDGDGAIDFPADSGCANAWDESEVPHDPACTGPNDPSEHEQCRDGIDNDSDIVIDAQDPGCWTNPNNPATYDPNIDDESRATTQCQDGLDNDADGTADFPGDFSCSSKTDNDETNPKSQCQDGIDNDGDGLTDLNDPGCVGKQDNDEYNTPAQCQDGIDNDGDGAVDYPADFSCSSPTDNDETNPKSQCQDGIDNDGDGKVDLTDPGCSDKQDNTETDPVAIISPVLECVQTNSNGTYTAYFGYSNFNATATTIAAGTNTTALKNAFSPGSTNRGQPSSFAPGRAFGIYGVTFDGAPLTWSIKVPGSSQTSSVTATSSSNPCKAIEPMLECVQPISSNGYVARYGFSNPNNFTIRIPIGSDNTFLPDPANRGQPEAFAAGRLVNSFYALFDSSTSITWKVGTRTAQASGNSPFCQANQKPLCSIAAPVASACQGAETKVLLDGSASRDPEQVALTYQWQTSCSDAQFSSAQHPEPVLSLTGPGLGNAASCAVTLTVSDGVFSSQCSAPISVSACSDCPAGQPKDLCGVCGGSNACVDCSGQPFGNSTLDKCGVCGGSNACLDCQGTIGGSKVLDQCGVCGGDGTSCLDCISSDTTSILVALDAGARDQKNFVVKSAKRYEKLAGKTKAATKFSAKVRKQADAYYKNGWTITWSLPQSVLSCSNSAVCTQKDMMSTISSYNDNAAKLRGLTQSLARKIAKAGSSKSLKLSHSVLKKGEALFEQVIKNSSLVPRFNSTCGGSVQ